MPWDMKDYPDAFKNFDHTIRKKAIEIANGLLANGYEDDSAIPIAIEQAKEWANNASEEEFESFKYGSQPKKSDDHEEQGDPDLLDNDVLVYFEDDEWIVKTENAKQAAETFEHKKDAVKRAEEIADNRGTKVIQYTRDGKKQS